MLAEVTNIRQKLYFLITEVESVLIRSGYMPLSLNEEREGRSLGKQLEKKRGSKFFLIPSSLTNLGLYLNIPHK